MCAAVSWGLPLLINEGVELRNISVSIRIGDSHASDTVGVVWRGRVMCWRACRVSERVGRVVSDSCVTWVERITI